jgi:DNA recombination protein RmuC
MIETLLVVAVVLLAVLVVLAIAASARQSATATRVEQLTLALAGQQERRADTEAANQRALREEIGAILKGQFEQQLGTLQALGRTQSERLSGIGDELGKLTESNAKRMEVLRATLDGKLKDLQEDNTKKLESIRETVDQKLQGVLEKRLADSFKTVSERLEQVHKGLGEMQNLAQGVGDLKRVLTNVKTRGTWGEIQLGNLLEQVLTKEQYESNVAVKPRSQQRVEFAIRLPGRGEDEAVVWLPIDSKFPQEDWLRLTEAAERADALALEDAGRALEGRVRDCARDIRDKYISPPHTTDFAILFLPTEGLYAEIVRRTKLVEQLQRELRVIVAGPMVLGALLNSLQMGFRTLAIEKRSSEVWKVLSAVKTEFGRFGETLGKVKQKLEQASQQLEDEVGRRTRMIERKLKDVQGLPASEASLLLGGTPEEAALAEPDPLDVP